eukprot:6455562-Prymnesium_polylepis.1
MPMCGTVQYGAVRCGTVQYGVVRCDTAYGAARCGTVQCAAHAHSIRMPGLHRWSAQATAAAYPAAVSLAASEAGPPASLPPELRATTPALSAKQTIRGACPAPAPASLRPPAAGPLRRTSGTARHRFVTPLGRSGCCPHHTGQPLRTAPASDRPPRQRAPPLLQPL